MSRLAAVRGGIDLGGTKIQTAVVDDGEVVAEARRPTPTKGGPEDVAREMVEAMREAAEGAKLETSALEGIGVGSPGDVDEKTGSVANARNLPDWEGSFPLADNLSEALGAPARVGNDVQVAVNAEAKLGAGRPYTSFIGVFWGTGVGGGVILDRKEWLGRGAAGEIGHMVIKEGGARCTCGRRGCLEAYAGRGAMEIHARKEHEDGKKTELFKVMKHKGHDRLTSSVWEHALKDGDKLAEHLIDRAVKALAAGIASAVNLLDVEAVVIGGGLGVRFGDPYVKRISKHMQKHLFVDDNPPAMHVVELGDFGGAIGASLLFESK